ncbi:MAG: hypothetical protein JXR10_15240 [Cyclobacteriaceae bacterium]
MDPNTHEKVVLIEKKYFLAYLTANEKDFSVDYLNFLNMTKRHPGVLRVHVYIAVSEVKERRRFDDVAISLIENLINQCDWLELNQVIYKNNIGRDFSSAQACLNAIAEVAHDQDEILVRNRSAYGPFESDWYKKYADLLNSNEKIGLVGNTINQSGHPKVVYQESEHLAHVQTYLYLSRFKIFKDFIADFPGANETDRLTLINKGEIGLSQKIIERGYHICCLNWPDVFAGRATTLPKALPTNDTKLYVLNLPFIHRKSKIRYQSLQFRVRWGFLLFWRLTDYHN